MYRKIRNAALATYWKKVDLFQILIILVNNNTDHNFPLASLLKISLSFLGGVGMMCPLSEQGKQLAVQVCNILGMDVCGIDLLQLNDGSFVVCEANANVGFIAFDQACGMDVAGIVADYALSLLPSRLSRKMSLLSVVSSTSETSSEPEGCIPTEVMIPTEVCIPNGICPPGTTCAIPDGMSTMSTSSTSSESEGDLNETGSNPVNADPAYNINSLLASEMKLLTEWITATNTHRFTDIKEQHILKWTLNAYRCTRVIILTLPVNPCLRLLPWCFFSIDRQ